VNPFHSPDDAFLPGCRLVSGVEGLGSHDSLLVPACVVLFLTAHTSRGSFYDDPSAFKMLFIVASSHRRLGPVVAGSNASIFGFMISLVKSPLDAS